MKSIFASKTFWVNSIVTVTSLATYIADSALLANHPETVALIGTGIGMLNVILRLMTKEAVTVKKVDA